MSSLVGLVALAGCASAVEEPTDPVIDPVDPVKVPLTSYQGEKGSILPSGGLMAEVGSTVTYTITPAKNYDLFELKVNGEMVDETNLAYDAVTDTYSWNWTVVEDESLLFEPIWLHDDAILTAGEQNVIVDGTYDFYWIRSKEVTYELSGGDYTLYYDPTDLKAEETIVLPNFNTVECGVTVDLNGYAAEVGVGGVYNLPTSIIGDGASITFTEPVRWEAQVNEEFNKVGLENVDFYFTKDVSAGGNLITSDVPVVIKNCGFSTAPSVLNLDEDADVLASYDGFGDLSNLDLRGSTFDGDLDFNFTHIGKVEMDGNVIEGTVNISQGVTGHHFNITNNDFTNLTDGVAAPAIYISKEASANMNAVSKVGGNVFNAAAEYNVIHGAGSYETQFADALIVFEGVKVKDLVN